MSAFIGIKIKSCTLFLQLPILRVLNSIKLEFLILQVIHPQKFLNLLLHKLMLLLISDISIFNYVSQTTLFTSKLNLVLKCAYILTCIQPVKLIITIHKF